MVTIEAKPGWYACVVDEPGRGHYEPVEVWRLSKRSDGAATRIPVVSTDKKIDHLWHKPTNTKVLRGELS